MITIADKPLTMPVLVCVTIIQFCMLNNRCQTEERKEAFAFLLLWTLFFQSSHFFSCHDSVNRSLSFSHACCILMRDQFMNVICKAKKGPALQSLVHSVLGAAPPSTALRLQHGVLEGAEFLLFTFYSSLYGDMQQTELTTECSDRKVCFAIS